MAIISDEMVQACICGIDKKTKIERTAKRRVLTWMGTVAFVGFLLTLAVYPELLVEQIDAKSIIAFSVVLYLIIGMIYKFVDYGRKKHGLLCSLRRAYLEIV